MKKQYVSPSLMCEAMETLDLLAPSLNTTPVSGIDVTPPGYGGDNDGSHDPGAKASDWDEEQ